MTPQALQKSVWDFPRPPHLEPEAGSSFCEWGGPTLYWTLALGTKKLPGVACS